MFTRRFPAEIDNAAARQNRHRLAHLGGIPVAEREAARASRVYIEYRGAKLWAVNHGDGVPGPAPELCLHGELERAAPHATDARLCARANIRDENSTRSTIEPYRYGIAKEQPRIGTIDSAERRAPSRFFKRGGLAEPLLKRRWQVSRILRNHGANGSALTLRTGKRL